MTGLLVATIALANAKPNVVYIMADDLGYGDVGCFGQTKIPTPNIDRIAAEGIKMTRAYSASAVCAPTRYSLLTGKHQGHAAIRGNKEQGGFGPNDKEGQMPIALSEKTIAEVLKPAGYRTGIVGKWGLGGTDPDQTPMAHGFDFFYGYLCQRRSHNFYPSYLWRNHDVDLLDNPMFNAHQKIASPLATEGEYDSRYGGKTYSAEKLAEASVSFIKNVKPGQPLFLYYAPTLPHLALQAPKEWVDRFPRDWDPKPYLGQNAYLPNARPRATYAAMVAFLDDSVGRILTALEETGRLKDTLIVFTSDNGAVRGVGGVDVDFFRSNGDFRAGKMSLYEGGIRVPFVARWPGQIPTGKSSNHIVTSYDALATLCEVAGIDSPQTDGTSYLSALRGGKPKPRPFVYFEYPEASAMQAVMVGNYKAIRPDLKKQPERIELYDLEADPSEKTDLASKLPDVLRQAEAIMKREHVPNRDFPLGVLDK